MSFESILGNNQVYSLRWSNNTDDRSKYVGLNVRILVDFNKIKLMITQKKYVIKNTTGEYHSSYYEFIGKIEFPLLEKKIRKYSVISETGYKIDRYYLIFNLIQVGGENIELFFYDFTEERVLYKFRKIKNGDKIKVFLTKKKKDKNNSHKRDVGEFEFYDGTTLHNGSNIFKESFKNKLLFFFQVNEISSILILMLIGPLFIILPIIYSWWSFAYSIPFIIILYIIKETYIE